MSGAWISDKHQSEIPVTKENFGAIDINVRHVFTCAYSALFPHFDRTVKFSTSLPFRVFNESISLMSLRPEEVSVLEHYALGRSLPSIQGTLALFAPRPWPGGLPREG